MTSSNHKDIMVIYHADCLDGFGAAWCAFKKFGNQARYIPARFGDAFPKHHADCDAYVLDFSYAPATLFKAAKTLKRLTLIDHHLTAMAAFDTVCVPDNVTLQFDLAHSGCVLAWQHFFPEKDVPMILKHIQDRDLWQFELNGTKEITTALYEQMPMSFGAFDHLSLNRLFSVGKIQVAQLSKMMHRLVHIAHPITLGNITGLAVNANAFFASDLGHLLAEKAGGMGVVYYYNGAKQHWNFGLRSVGDVNVGALAVEFGGGGHLNAAGFTLPNNPFLPSANSIAKTV
jgi:oligoribonuclease NrnB/cAMP/cGMP phosphodiesterase (DHH superfamily)